MSAVPMSGGMMPMAWMPMCGQSWMAAAASFLGMWVLMMAAMMLPSLAIMLWRYRRAVGGAGEPSPSLLTVLVACGYLLVWTLLGAAVYPLGVAALAVTMRCPALAGAAPLAVGLVVLTAGALQLTRWKARHLACCRNDCRSEGLECRQALAADAPAAWRHGVRLGIHCSLCCAGLTAALLFAGLMNGPWMLAATGAINLERLAPGGGRIARTTGVLMIGAGLLLTARAAGLP